MTKNKYSNIQECDEMANSYEKSWTDNKHQVFTYQVFILCAWSKRTYAQCN
jgi:hypothetical protein